MDWKIELNNLCGGLAPNTGEDTYPSYGEKSQAGRMFNCDLTYPGLLKPGPSPVLMGDQTTTITTLIKGGLNFVTSANTSYCIGGAKLYQISPLNTVTSDGTWPHTIDKGGVTGEDGEDVVLYQSNLYYSYNHSGSAGDIGKYDLASTFDDDWGSTVPTGAAALTNNPHPMCVGGNDTFAFGNGRYVGTYDGTTLDTQALDLPTGYVVVSIKWKQDRWWITANYPNITTSSNINQASIFVWDGSASTWESEIKLPGRAGGSYVKNDVFYQFYEDLSSSGGYRLGYINGNSIVNVAFFAGGIPKYYQITENKNFIVWAGNYLIYMWGNAYPGLPNIIFQYAASTHTTGGGIFSPMASIFVASTNGTTGFRLDRFTTTYSTSAYWYSLNFDVTNGNPNSTLTSIRLNFVKLVSGNRLNLALKDDTGRTIYSDVISYSKNGAVTSYLVPLSKVVDNFRIELDWANDAGATPVSVKNIKFYGTAT